MLVADNQPDLEARVKRLEWQQTVANAALAQLSAAVQRHEAILEQLSGESPKGDSGD
jgi:hypothetical protein